MTSHVEHLECACTYPGHTIRVELYKGDVGDDVGLDPPELRITVNLSESDSFWKRLRYAFTYVFLSRTRAWTGWPFSESLLERGAVEQLYSLLLAWRVLDKMHQKKALSAVKPKGLP